MHVSSTHDNIISMCALRMLHSMLYIIVYRYLVSQPTQNSMQLISVDHSVTVAKERNCTLKDKSENQLDISVHCIFATRINDARGLFIKNSSKSGEEEALQPGSWAKRTQRERRIGSCGLSGYWCDQILTIMIS